ncbi:MAG: HAMP domain-containing sensor histidine kinase [Ferruginibacter sp.]
MKLLQKTIRNYFIYSVFVLLVAIPLFYLVMQRIVQEGVDDDLMATKEMLKPKISDAILNNTVGQLKFIDQDIFISITTYTRPYDTFKTIEVFDTLSQKEVPHRVLSSSFTINGKPCLLQVKTSLVNKNDLIKSIVKVQIVLLLLLLGGLFMINRSLSKRIWKPFYNTVNKLRNYKVENHEPLALAKSTVNEFDDLNHSLEALTERTYNTYISQKEFTENASHEMQSPLAVFQSKLELLMQTAPLNEEQAQLMGDLANASQRMARLNKSLVLLTKIENNQFAELEDVSLSQVVESYLQQYQPQAEEKHIAINSNIQSDTTVKANKALIEILIGNLLGNAIRHNYIKGTINVLLSGGKLSIENTGKLFPLDNRKIFERFQKESTDSNSIGLGLEMVEKICNIYHYELSYQYINHLHGFTIQFNKS